MPYLQAQPSKVTISYTSIPASGSLIPASGLILFHSGSVTFDSNNQPTTYVQIQFYSKTKASWEFLNSIFYNAIPSDGANVKIYNSNSSSAFYISFIILPASVSYYANVLGNSLNSIKGYIFGIDLNRTVTAGYGGSTQWGQSGVGGVYSFGFINNAGGTYTILLGNDSHDVLVAVLLPNGGM